MLGYTEVSWNDLSGKEEQPWSSIKYWASLTANEKAAAAVLGYTQVSWDNDSGSVTQPASAVKTWALLIACTDGEILLFHILRTPSSFFCLFVFSCEKKNMLAELLLNMKDQFSQGQFCNPFFLQIKRIIILPNQNQLRLHL